MYVRTILNFGNNCLILMTTSIQAQKELFSRDVCCFTQCFRPCLQYLQPVRPWKIYGLMRGWWIMRGVKRATKLCLFPHWRKRTFFVKSPSLFVRRIRRECHSQTFDNADYICSIRRIILKMATKENPRLKPWVGLFLLLPCGLMLTIKDLWEPRVGISWCKTLIKRYAPLIAKSLKSGKWCTNYQ